MRISNSKAKTWRRCPKKYEFKYEMELRPKRKSVQLERGSWLHDLLQHHYDGEDWKTRHKELTEEFYNLFEEEREDLGDLPTECGRIMRAYLRTYKHEDSRFRVVDSELDEIYPLPNGLKIHVIVDLIWEDLVDGGLWIVDHKTRKNIGDDTSMLLDPQLTVYYYILEQMGYLPLKGVIYNEICTKPPVVPQLLKRGGLSKRKNIATDVATYMREIRRHGLDPNDYADILRHIAAHQHNRFFRRTMIPKDPPVLKTMMKEMVHTAQEIREGQKRSRYPRTFIQGQCKWDCEYLDLCLTQLHGGDMEPLIKMNFERRKRGED